MDVVQIDPGIHSGLWTKPSLLTAFIDLHAKNGFHIFQELKKYVFLPEMAAIPVPTDER